MSDTDGRDGSPSDKPPLWLVQIAFGVRAFVPPAGAYFQGSVGTKITENRQGLEVITLVNSDDETMGAAFLFRGYPFFLWLVEAHPPEGVGGHEDLSVFDHRRISLIRACG